MIKIKKFFLRSGCLYVLIGLFWAGPAQAGVQQDLNKFFKSFGAATNTTSAGSYKDQSAGYYNGGSFFARVPSKNLSVGSLRLPGYRAGCGGIDMHFGAMSFIKGGELVRALRSIGSSMASYGMLLALETLSPQVKNIMTELNDLAQRINQTNINSCEMAATAMGALYPQSDVANKHLCAMIGTDKKYGAFSDYAEARQGCGAGGQRSQVLGRAATDDRYKNMLGQTFNLAWKALKEHDFLKTDPELAAFFMAISGTIVVVEHDGESPEVKTFPSMANNNALLEALLFGGEAIVYGCSDKDCLQVAQRRVTISSSESLSAKVKTILESIQTKIYEDQALGEQEIGFLNSTRLPFYKMINVSTAFRRGEAPLEISDYSELAAIDMMFHYVGMILEVMFESLQQLQKAQIDNSHIKAFQKGLNEARARIQEKRMGTFKQVEQVLAIIQKTELIEKMISAKLGTLAESDL